jgi:hypothetical protein
VPCAAARSLRLLRGLFLAAHNFDPTLHPLPASMNTKSFASFVLLAGLLLPATTHAESMIVELVNFSFGQGTPNALPSSSAPANVSVAKFDQSLGTLDSVTLSLQASGTVEADAFNNTASSQGYSQSMATLNFGVTGPDGSSIAINPSTPFFAGTIPAHAFIATGSSPFSLSPAAIDVLSSNFGLYEGSGGGVFTLSFNSDGQSGPITSSIFAPSGVFTGGNAHVSGTETVTYNFTPIPEPSVSGMVLGCATLMGVVGLRRRRPEKISSNFVPQGNSTIA